jgi:hypothetical protein
MKTPTTFGISRLVFPLQGQLSPRVGHNLSRLTACHAYLQRLVEARAVIAEVGTTDEGYLKLGYSARIYGFDFIEEHQWARVCLGLNLEITEQPSAADMTEAAESALVREEAARAISVRLKNDFPALKPKIAHTFPRNECGKTIIGNRQFDAVIILNLPEAEK